MSRRSTPAVTQEVTMANPYVPRAIAPTETPKLRWCLSSSCRPHQFLTTRAVRICERGRERVRHWDPYYSVVTMPVTTRQRARSDGAA